MTKKIVEKMLGYGDYKGPPQRDRDQGIQRCPDCGRKLIVHTPLFMVDEHYKDSYECPHCGTSVSD